MMFTLLTELTKEEASLVVANLAGIGIGASAREVFFTKAPANFIVELDSGILSVLQDMAEAFAKGFVLGRTLHVGPDSISVSENKSGNKIVGEAGGTPG